MGNVVFQNAPYETTYEERRASWEEVHGLLDPNLVHIEEPPGSGIFVLVPETRGSWMSQWGMNGFYFGMKRVRLERWFRTPDRVHEMIPEGQAGRGLYVEIPEGSGEWRWAFPRPLNILRDSPSQEER